MNRSGASIIRFMLILIFLTILVAACGQTPPSSSVLTPVTVQLSWLHQAEFAGFYAADQSGYYADEGLEVTFVEGGPEVDFIAPVISGEAQFGVAQPADVIIQRAAGKPIRSIAVIYRRSPIVFFALASSGITRPQDFVGETIRSTLTLDQTLRALMTKVGISQDQYQVAHLASDVELFASGEPAVWGGFSNVLVIDVIRAGYEINIIYPDDYGIHFYGDVLVTSDEMIAENPDLVQRFTRATLKGWQYAIENPAETGLFIPIYNPQADPELESEKITASIPLVNTGEDFIGWMRLETWSSMEQTLREQGLLAEDLDVSEVFTMQFLEEIYK